MTRQEYLNKIALMSDAEFNDLVAKSSEPVQMFKEGGKPSETANPDEVVKDLKKNPQMLDFPALEDFLNYIKSTRGGIDPNYDYEAFFNYPLTVENGMTPLQFFIYEEMKKPGKAHMSGDFKKPGHITYGGETGENWKQDESGIWNYFVPEDHLEGGEFGRSFEDYKKYWDENEEGSVLHYGNQTYKTGQKPSVGTKEVKIHKDGGSLIEQLKSQLGDSEIVDLLEHFGIDDLLKGGERTTKNMSIQIIIEGEEPEEDDGGHKAPELTTVEVGSKKYEVETISTKADMAKGLSGRKELDADKGMLFDFNSVQEEVLFNVAEMQFPIDIIFINDDDEVIKIAKDCQPGKDIFTCNDVRYVLEVNANSGIKVGDDFDNDPNSTDAPIMKVLAPDGSTQMELHGGERIFSRVASRRFIHWAKRCEASKKDSDYKHLGELMFKEIAAQDNRPPEYVEVPEE